MTPAEKFTTSNNDEIPLARRYKPVSPGLQRKIKILGSSVVLLGFFVAFGFKKLIVEDQLVWFQDQERLSSMSGSDSVLLGHLKYPEANSNDLVTIYPGMKVHRDTFSALQKMRNAASRDGIQLVLLSGFRSIDLQREIFYENKSSRNQIAIERARVSAPPGYSEHSTGYAIDLGDGTMRSTDFEPEFEFTPAFQWLQRNAARYHFVLSFPKGNPQGVSYEPWHWRFEGTVQALRQFEKSNQLFRLDSSQSE